MAQDISLPEGPETRFVTREGGVQIATQAFGSPENAPVIMIMGATASMLGWPDELCVGLAERGLFVIRFDHRDTGRSTTQPPGEVSYVVEDMAADVVATMDAYGLNQTHVIGMSLGAYIAQMLAVEHPARVETLTLISAEPLGWDGPELPHISRAFLDHFETLTDLDWSDRSKVAEFLLESDRLVAGSAQPFDAARARARIEMVLERTHSPASMFNHGAITTASSWIGRYREITCPVLVIHGEEDPILPIENGRAVASALAGSSLLVLSKVGHELPPSELDRIIASVAAHVGAFG